MAYKFNPLTGNLDDYGPVLTGTGTVSAAADGTTALPGIAFANELSTGVSRPGAGQLALSTNGTGRLFVDASGNINLGQSSSALQSGGTGLTVYGASASEIKLLNSTTGAAATDGTALVTSNNDFTINNREAGSVIVGTSNLERLRITSAGLVGIGTSNPQGSLHVVGNSATAGVGNINISNAAFPTSGWAFRIPDSGSTIDLSLDGAVGGTFRSVMYFARSTGAVGIGTTSPGYLLDLSASTPVLNITSSASSGDGAQIRFVQNFGRVGRLYLTSESGLGSGSMTLESPDGRHIIFSHTSSERARIDNLGRLLVGTNSTSSVNRLIVQSSSDAPTGAGTLFIARGDNAPLTTNVLGALRFGGSTHVNSAEISAFRDGGTWTAGSSLPTGLTFSTTADGAASPTERLRITSAGVLQVADAGNIAVGTTTGTKIGTATTQKLGFFNKTPVVQPAAVADATDAASVITQLNALLARMRDLGLIAT